MTAVTLRASIPNLAALQQSLAGQQKQIAYAAAVALTRTAQALQREIPAALERSLDRPTAFTKRGTFVQRARRDNLTAVTGFKDLQAEYLRWHIEGGLRQAGKGGLKLPGNITVDSHGNIPRGVIAQLKDAARNGKLTAALTRRIAGKAQRKGSPTVQLFYGAPKGKAWQNAPVGLWRRNPGQSDQLIPVIVFPRIAARYRPRFDLAGLGRAVVAREWPAQFDAALASALATAR